MANPSGMSRSTFPESPTLLPDRAFVVEFTTDGEGVRDDQLSGRVEHVVSGQATRFATGRELLEFVQGVLRSRASTRKKRSVDKRDELKAKETP
jgi:hypothetical protein